MENQKTISTISDRLCDDAIIYKLFSNPTLFETLKQIENVEVFTALEFFCTDELKVFFFLLITTIVNF